MAGRSSEHDLLRGAEDERRGRRQSGWRKRRPKSAVPAENPLASAADAATIPQVKVWLTGDSNSKWL